MAAAIEIKTDFIALAKSHPGQWVAIDPDTGKVVASGSSAAAVFESATQAGVSDPIITGVSDDYGAYVSCLIA